jgi:protein pelota
MKLIKKAISAKDGSGQVVLKIVTSEDLWHAYNLLQTHDRVRSTTLRKVVKESSTGSTVSNKKRLSLTIEVLKVFFDPDTLEVRLSGPNREESTHVRLGAHHTITISIGIQFTLEKACWDQIYLDRLDESTHPERTAEVAAVVMSMGLCHVCLVTDYLTIVKAKLEVPIPKKRGAGSTTNHAKAISRFYEAIYQAILRHVDFTKVKCCLLASPGFVKDDFFQYLIQHSERSDDRVLIENKSKFVLCKASSGHKHALEEVLQDPAVTSQMADTKVNRLSRFEFGQACLTFTLTLMPIPYFANGRCRWHKK